MRARSRSASCGNSRQIHSATPALRIARMSQRSGVESPDDSSKAVTAAAAVMNSAFMMFIAAIVRARAASSLRRWMIA